MRKYCRAVLRLLLCFGIGAGAFAQGLSNDIGLDSGRFQNWVLQGAGLDFDFTSGRFYQAGQTAGDTTLITVARASSGTNLLPASASGAAVVSFGNNIARITTGLGILIEESRTNLLLNSTAPATQTTTSLATGTYILWVNGSGSATMSAGTGTGCGTGSATQGVVVSFTISVAGTCTVTVAGSLSAFQLELGTFGTSLIVTAGATATRVADIVTVTSVPAFGTAYTLLGKGTPNAPAAFGNNQPLISVDDGTTNQRSQIHRAGGSGTAIAFFVPGSVTVAASAAITQGVSSKVIAAFAASDQAIALNGGALVSNASGTPPSGGTITTIHVGARFDGATPWNGYLERIAVWPSARLANATLLTMTAP